MGILILGGGYGGTLAAARIARRGVPVTLIDSGDGLVERIRLHQLAAGDDLAPIPYAKLFRGLDVEVVRGRVERIDRAARRVYLRDGESHGYDTLVYALGSTIDTMSVPGVTDHAFALTSPVAARALQMRLRDAAHVVVCGGGLTGIELSTEIGERFPNVRVTLVTSDSISRNVSPRGEAHLRNAFARNRVTLREEACVMCVDDSGVELADGSRINADAVVWCASFRVSPIAAECGLDVDASGRIVVDRHLRASDPHVYAIGDAAAATPHGATLRMACATAMPMAAYVADLLTGATHAPFRFAFAIRCISLGRRDALVQLVHPDDAPKSSVITGRPAAIIKELICRLAASAVRFERHGVPYTWPKAA